MIPSPLSPPAPTEAQGPPGKSPLSRFFRFKTASRRLRDETKTRRRYQDDKKTSWKASRSQLDPNFALSWTPRGPLRPVIYDVFLTFHFSHVYRLETLKMTPGTPQEARRGASRGPKRAPRRPQDGSKTLPRRVRKRLYVGFISRPANLRHPRTR